MVIPIVPIIVVIILVALALYCIRTLITDAWWQRFFTVVLVVFVVLWLLGLITGEGPYLRLGRC